jgi:hypothetical protein
MPAYCSCCAIPLCNYATIFGSVEEVLVNHGSHHHTLYSEDNALVYFYLEETTFELTTVTNT